MKLLPSDLLCLTTLLLTSTASALPLTRRSATFSSLTGLTSLSHDFSKSTSATAPSKFFHESTFSYHYDGRFASEPLPHATRLVHLRLMLRAYTTTMARIGVRTWLMHGGLLGWWWSGNLMPWDTDLDYMVDERGIGELGGWWNMSVHEFGYRDFGNGRGIGGIDEEQEGGEDDETEKKGEDAWKDLGITKKKYLLEVNPQFTNTSTKDKANRIDARWIDTSTGLFIDITTLHIQPYSTLPPKNRPFSSNERPLSSSNDIDDIDPDIPLYSKDSHAYTSTQLFPLRTTTFEDTLTLVPFDYEAVLLDEYGADAITQTWYRGWKFERERGGWVRDEEEEGVWDGDQGVGNEE